MTTCSHLIMSGLVSRKCAGLATLDLDWKGVNLHWLWQTSIGAGRKWQEGGMEIEEGHFWWAGGIGMA